MPTLRHWHLGRETWENGCSSAVVNKKMKFVFGFSGGDELLQLRGGRGDYVYYSEDDYPVEPDRQEVHGETDKVKEQYG